MDESLWSGEITTTKYLPSQFDYTLMKLHREHASFSSPQMQHAEDDNPYDDAMTRGQYQGTWSDILVDG